MNCKICQVKSFALVYESHLPIIDQPVIICHECYLKTIPPTKGDRSLYIDYDAPTRKCIPPKDPFVEVSTVEGNMNDLQELLKRIYEFSGAYENSGYKKPFFRLTPYEHGLLLGYLRDFVFFIPEFFGDLPTCLGANFELVGNPQLFDGKHIRSDSGIAFETIKKGKRCDK